MVNADLAAALRIPVEDSSDEQVISTITSLLISAVHDAQPEKTLADIYHDITTFSGSSYLDPLNTIPLLLPCEDPSARSIISLIGECGSAKEVVMTVQEAAERLEIDIQKGDSDDDVHEQDRRTSFSHNKNSSAVQFLTLVDLYASAIPRIKLRQKTASDTLKPLLEQLVNLAKLIYLHATEDEACAALSSMSHLAIKIKGWLDFKVALESREVEQAKCHAILGSFLDQCLLSCRSGLHNNLSQQTLQAHFPRLARSQPVQTSGEKAIREWLDAYNSLNIHLESLTRHASTSDLIFYAYLLPTRIDIEKLLAFLRPVLISSMQTNTFLSESFTILIAYLLRWQASKHMHSLSQDITDSLCGIMPSVASVHPDPSIRHQALIVLSLLLSNADPRLRFQHLLEYTVDPHYPQLRVASVNLVKEAVIQSLSSTGKTDDPLCSSLFLRSFGLILFRPNPPDLLKSTLTLHEFQEAHEDRRLIECLSLYYVLLSRDNRNLTGIRDIDVCRAIETNLLKPLETVVDRWLDQAETSSTDLHDFSPAVSIKVGLERIKGTLHSLQQ